MEKRALGSGGPMVSPIGIGAMSFSGMYGASTEAEAHALLDESISLGIDHIDTSNIYGMGRSEAMIGSYLASRGAEARDWFKIATKAGISRDPSTGKSTFDNSPDHLASELDGSLKRLGVDCVDLFYVHRRDKRIEIEEVTETLAGFIKAGKVQAIAYSEIAPWSLRRAAAVHPIAAVQSEYSLQTRYPDLGLVQECERLGTALVAFSPVGRGLLTDNPPDADRVAASPILENSPRFNGANFAANLTTTDKFRRLAADMGYPTAGLAIAWLLTRSPKVVPIPGTRSVSHLRELAAGCVKPLTADELARIEDVLPVGWAHGDRYPDSQWIGPERYC